MIEDIERILNCSASEEMSEDFFLIKKIDPELLKEGFRMIYLINHREDMDHLLKHYNSFQILGPRERDWIIKYYQGILSGERNPKVFFNLIKDKMKEAEKRNSSLSPTFQINDGLSSTPVNSEKLKKILMNKKQEGYYFRKFK